MSSQKKEEEVTCAYPHIPAALLPKLNRLLDHAQGPKRLADDLLAIFELVVLHNDDVLTNEDRGKMYFPWQLMKELREVAETKNAA